MRYTTGYAGSNGRASTTYYTTPTAAYRFTPRVAPMPGGIAWVTRVLIVLVVLAATVVLAEVALIATKSTVTIDVGSYEPSERRALPPATGPTTRTELAALTGALRDIDRIYYGGSLPDVPVYFANYPTGSNAGVYAFTDGSNVSFVPEHFEYDWDWNVQTLKHEAAHVAAGPNHGHDGWWKREFDRLMAPPNVRQFEDVRREANR